MRATTSFINVPARKLKIQKKKKKKYIHTGSKYRPPKFVRISVCKSSLVQCVTATLGKI